MPSRAQYNANVSKLNSFLNPTGPSDAATASLRAQRAQQWQTFVNMHQSRHQ